MCPHKTEPDTIGTPAPDRRRFVEVVLGGGLLASLVSFVYPILRYLVPPATPDLGSDTVVAGRIGDLKPNSGKIFRFGSRPGLLVLTPEKEYRAMAATCTHLDCTVQYRDDLHQVWCACHNGIYDLNGRNVSGPPPRPLDTYEVHVRGEEIIVERRKSASRAPASSERLACAGTCKAARGPQERNG